MGYSTNDFFPCKRKFPCRFWRLEVRRTPSQGSHVEFERAAPWWWFTTAHAERHNNDAAVDTNPVVFHTSHTVGGAIWSRNPTVLPKSILANAFGFSLTSSGEPPRTCR